MPARTPKPKVDPQTRYVVINECYGEDESIAAVDFLTEAEAKERIGELIEDEDVHEYEIALYRLGDKGVTRVEFNITKTLVEVEFLD